MYEIERQDVLQRGLWLDGVALALANEGVSPQLVARVKQCTRRAGEGVFRIIRLAADRGYVTGEDVLPVLKMLPWRPANAPKLMAMQSDERIYLEEFFDCFCA